VKVLGVNKRNVKKSVEKHLLLDTLRSVFKMDYKWAIRLDVLFQQYVELVVDCEATSYPSTFGSMR
jgi:hypothetical protein